MIERIAAAPLSMDRAHGGLRRPAGSGSRGFGRLVWGLGPVPVRVLAAHGCERYSTVLPGARGRTVVVLVHLARLLAGRVDGIILSDFEQGGIGPDLFRHACLIELKGLVSKRADSRYRGGRSPNRVKIKNPNLPAMNRALDAFS